MVPRLFAAVVGVAGLFPTPAAAQLPAGLDLRTLQQAITLFQSAGELSARADALLGKEQPAAVSTPHAPTLTGVYLVLEYRYADQTGNMTYWNQVMGRRVPGRNVTVALEGVETVVEAKYDLRQVTISRDPDYPDIVTVTLPRPELTARATPGGGYKWVVTWDELRTGVDPALSARLVSRLLGHMAEDAKGRFEKERLTGVATDIQKALRGKLPGTKLYVK